LCLRGVLTDGVLDVIFELGVDLPERQFHDIHSFSDLTNIRFDA
jgi:hypothetical protein